MTTTRTRLLPLRARVVVATTLGTLLSVLLAAGSACGFLGDDDAQSASASTCFVVSTNCSSGSITDGSVNIIGNQTTPGQSGLPDGAISWGGGIIVVPPPSLNDQNMSFQCMFRNWQLWFCPTDGSATTPGRPSTPPITLTDIADFVPMNPSLDSEPHAWGLRGLPVNFVGGSPVHTVSGTLLGADAEVRFWPMMYLWSFGDGQSQSTSGAGVSWANLGLAPFTPTATSHTYWTTGTMNAQVTVSYSPEYRINGGSWRSVAGFITKTASVRLVIIDDGEPSLVTRPCVPGRAAVGC